MAERVFLMRGFGATTMQVVAAEAGASKETLYRHFGSKGDLFAEVVGNRARLLREKLDADFDRPHAMAEVLRDLGTNLLTHMSGPEVMCLLRIVISEAPRDPDLGRIFFASGPERTRKRLAEYLEAARARGEFHGRSAALAANIFLAAVVGSLHMVNLTLHDPPVLTPAEIRERVDEAVAMFLNYYG
ncbi:TetR/AcrR family transcriptional regulator [Lichenifustis flavocetrariae]|uniref:TetR/AcrR family transcriptional regulator n=1 Tax=Lichenifustis flavocetrariae TaxID=2949735 RepID=A0AA41YX64_9HYPH|nr:TetR/AcrR family transcriptional regulator [Lichenifustis flavocetrariae]MCW6508925.1 TetR/AcrR family transcriptional regulator [Lichenifustis flavocetrariae]